MGASAQSIPVPQRDGAKTPAAPQPAPRDQGPPLAPLSKTGKQPVVEEPRRDAVPEGGILEMSMRWVEVRPADAPAAATEEERRRELIGRLVFSRVTVDAERVPLRKLLRELRRKLGLNMIVFEKRVQDGTVTSGVDGDAPIDVSLFDLDGYGVLDAIAAMAAGDAAWQVTGGVIEFGPKSLLARPEARRSEVVDVGDLALVTPDFVGQMGVRGIESYNRLDSDEVLADLIRNISTHCEPEAFEPDPERMQDPAQPTKQSAPGPQSTSVTRARLNPNTNAWRNLDPSIGPIYVHGKWASMQLRETAIAVIAPDFVLRRIVGYPNPLPPREVIPPTPPAASAPAPSKPK